MTGETLRSRKTRKLPPLAEFQEAVASLMHVWSDQVATDEDPSPVHVFLGLLSRPIVLCRRLFGGQVGKYSAAHCHFRLTVNSILPSLPCKQPVSTATDCSAKSRHESPKPCGVSDTRQGCLRSQKLRRTGNPTESIFFTLPPHIR